MTGLMPDIRGMHRTNIEYAEALEAQDHAILSKCSTQCSDKCIGHIIVKEIGPQPDYTGPADASTLLQRYKDNRPKEGLRLPAPTALPSDVKKLKRICFRNCPLAKSKELSQAIDARQQAIDILQLFLFLLFPLAVVSLLSGSISCFISLRVLRLLTLAILSMLSAFIGLCLSLYLS